MIKRRVDPLGTVADADRHRELVALGEAERGADRPEQARSGLGDLAQRPFGVAGRLGDRAQDVRRRLLLLARLVEFGAERRDPRFELGARRRRRIGEADGAGGLAAHRRQPRFGAKHPLRGRSG